MRLRAPALDRPCDGTELPRIRAAPGYSRNCLFRRHVIVGKHVLELASDLFRERIDLGGRQAQSKRCSGLVAIHHEAQCRNVALCTPEVIEYVADRARHVRCLSLVVACLRARGVARDTRPSCTRRPTPPRSGSAGRVPSVHTCVPWLLPRPRSRPSSRNERIDARCDTSRSRGCRRQRRTQPVHLRPTAFVHHYRSRVAIVVFRMRFRNARALNSRRHCAQPCGKVPRVGTHPYDLLYLRAHPQQPRFARLPVRASRTHRPPVAARHVRRARHREPRFPQTSDVLRNSTRARARRRRGIALFGRAMW